MAKDEYSKEDFRHLRPGHVNQGRVCDDLVTYATYLMPGTGVLPQRWRWSSQEEFNSAYRDLGPFVWAKTSSYHLLLLNGRHSLRIWTDSPASCLVDLDDKLALDVSKSFEILSIPETSLKKTKPFTKRVRVTTKQELQIILLQAILTFNMVG